jgi:ribonuclease HII
LVINPDRFFFAYTFYMARWIIGVDEAGRGPLAGPVAVGFVAVPASFTVRKAFPGLRDSKEISLNKREELYEMLRERTQAGELKFCVRYSAASTIDRLGLTRAVARATYRGVRALAPEPRGVRVLLDGLLLAPQEYEQNTIIGGDEREPLIMLASIVAKVRRDRLMARLAQRYPQYDFEVHKGYGTKAHSRAIKKFGLCEIHRRLFCRSFISAV